MIKLKLKKKSRDDDLHVLHKGLNNFMFVWKLKIEKSITKSCLLFGHSFQFTSKKVTQYLLGTRETTEIFKLYELRYLLLKIYPSKFMEPFTLKKGATSLLKLLPGRMPRNFYSVWKNNWSALPFSIVTRDTTAPKPKPGPLTQSLLDYLHLWPWYQWVSSLIVLIILYLVVGHYYNKWLSDSGGWLTTPMRCGLILVDLLVNLSLGMYYVEHRQSIMGGIMVKCPIAISPVIFLLELICVFLYYYFLAPYFKKRRKLVKKIKIKEKTEEEKIQEKILEADQRFNHIVDSIIKEMRIQMEEHIKDMKTEDENELTEQIGQKIKEILDKNVGKIITKIWKKREIFEPQWIEAQMEVIRHKQHCRKVYEENEKLFARKPGEPEYRDEDRIL